MINQIMRLKFVINGRDYVLLCDSDSPTGDVKEVACQIIHHVVQIEKDAMANAIAKAKEDAEAVQSESENKE